MTENEERRLRLQDTCSELRTALEYLIELLNDPEYSISNEEFRIVAALKAFLKQRVRRREEEEEL